MKGTLQITVDLEASEVRLGSERVRLLPVIPAPASDLTVADRTPVDLFQLNNAHGPIVRALRFEERSRLLSDAADSDVATHIAQAALVSPGECSDVIRVAVSLALAGGAEQAPSFSECARFALQQRGWDAQRVGETLALLVDRACANMAHAIVDNANDNGWNQIVFVEREPDVETLVSCMVTNLSIRSAGDATEERKSHRGFPETTNETTDNKEHTDKTCHDKIDHALVTRDKVKTREGIQEPQARSTSFANKNVASSRISARVIGLNTDRPTRSQPIAVATVPGFDRPSPAPQLTYSQLEHNNALSQLSITQRSDLSSHVSSIPAPPSHTSFSLAQTSPATLAPAQLFPSVAFPFESSPTAAQWSAGEQTSRPVSQTSASANSPSLPTDDSFSAWLAELAALLEAECDMRGIDP